MTANLHSGGNPLPFTQVKIKDNFWAPRIKTISGRSIPSQYTVMNENGRIPAFRLDWKPGMEPVPHIFWDSDVAKWIEAACYALSVQPNPGIETIVDEVVNLVISAQQPDGYLNTYFTIVEPEKRWANLRDCHELYSAGHIFEAAVAHYRATGKRDYLDAACRYADYIDSVFGADFGKKRGYCGHEEIELALIKLYEVTGNERYLKLSEYFIEERGRKPHYFDQEAIERGEEPSKIYSNTYEYAQADVQIREQKRVAGHAVRAMYYYSAAADLAGISGDENLYQVLERLWESLISSRIYITGGIGSSASNEGFTEDYDLPNETAYAETCAAIGLVLWSHRMLRMNPDRKYADMMERALYNGSISGISLDGLRYFYVNPLASSGKHHRDDWFTCSCCPPNIARLIASVGGYAYSYTDTDAIIHLYVQSEADLNIGSRLITIKQETNYPWNGDVTISMGVEQPSVFGVKLRIPGWCEGAAVRVNGESLDISNLDNGYLRIEREWHSGDRIELSLPMPVRLMHANPKVKQDAGMVALQRGPIVYCLEQSDNSPLPHQIMIPMNTQFETKFEPNLLGGVITIATDALYSTEADWGNNLYRSTPPQFNPCRVTAVPYCVWDNREPGWMSVWMRSA